MIIGGKFDYGLGACECLQFFFFIISFGFSSIVLYNIDVTSFRTFMEKYFSIGYYNCLDALLMKGCSADKVVEYMNKGIGDFHPYDEDGQTEISAEWLIEKYHGKITEDGEYIVVYDVSDRFNDVPLDLVLWNADDEIIEIYRRTR